MVDRATEGWGVSALPVHLDGTNGSPDGREPSSMYAPGFSGRGSVVGCITPIYEGGKTITD